MRSWRKSLYANIAALAVLLMFGGAVLAADDDDDVASNEVVANDKATEEVEEIIVYAYRSGDKVDVDARYEELFRSRASMELSRLEVLDEEYQWRKTMSENESESRIKWGYNPEAEQAMRRDTSLEDLSFDSNKPATVLRVQF